MKIVLLNNDGTNDQIVAVLEVNDIQNATSSAGTMTSVFGEADDGRSWTLVFDDAAVLGLVLNRQERLQTATDILQPLNKEEAQKALHLIHSIAYPMDLCQKKETEEFVHASRRCVLASNHRTKCIFGPWIKD